MTQIAIATQRQAVVSRLESAAGDISDHSVVYATDSTDLLSIALNGTLSVILMDMRSYGAVGIPLIQLLAHSVRTPVVAFLDAPDQDPSLLFEAGAIDVLSLFAPGAELASRVRAAKRRVERGGMTNTVRIGGLSFNLVTEELFVDEAPVHLTPTELAVFRILALNHGRVVSDRELLQAVWGAEYIDAVEYLRVYIGYLRAKIDRKCDENDRVRACSDSYFKRERGRGYRLEHAHSQSAVGFAAS